MRPRAVKPWGEVLPQRVERVDVVAEERPALSDDEHAHDVEADHRALHVRFGQVRDCHPLERPAVGMLVGDALAGVGVDLAADEDQLAVLVGGYEVDGVLAVAPAVFEDVDGHGVLQRLLEQPERLRVALGRVAGLGHVVHPAVDLQDREVAEPHVAQPAADLPRLGAVAAHGGGLDGAALLLVVQEHVHELAHRHAAAGRAALALEVQYQLVALPLRLLAGLRGNGVV